MITTSVAFLLALVVSLCVTPVVRHMALKFRLVDSAGVSHRKVHAQDMPRLGGIGIVIGFYTPLLGLFVVRTDMANVFLNNMGHATGLMAGGLIIVLLGLYDDLIGAGPKEKFLGQIAASLVVIGLGTMIVKIDMPFFAPWWLPTWLAVPATIIWIVGVTNAVNLIDGLDGLAAGLAVIGLMPFAALALANNDLILLLVTATLMGSTSGFLAYNYHPAKIFMGDVGSMFLGFVLAVTAVQTNQKTTGLAALMLPVLALGLPLLDTGLAFARRLWFGQNPFAGDKEHIHHRLMRAGLSHRRTVQAMWLIAASFALLGLLTATNRNATAGLVLGLSGVVAGILMRRIGYLKVSGIREQMRKGAEVRAYHRRLHADAGSIEQRIRTATTREEALAEFDTYLHLIQALSARLELDDSDVIWQWGQGAEENGTLRIPLTANGEGVGTLSVHLDDQSPVSVAEEKLKRGAAALAPRLTGEQH